MKTLIRGGQRRAIMKFIDIGVNLTDSMYSGEYNGSSKHPSDLVSVLDRSKQAGMIKVGSDWSTLSKYTVF